ncbi:hypothetical protein BCF33_2265 [Hasllibacter halocynthiae]|uniref:Lipoprotein n=1 Tax=Hasllibacter halocynthiae TaxID=595589 RepID=A0A2T0X3A5_9RHOB|nr:hypothetical protein [Hasllibacter halocynthiae]PRY93397.1 hypothetical protein BCF33_2265 [Hasllibacter halocynthiae]
MRLLLVILLLAACSGPQPAFRGVPAATVQRDGFTFHVRRSGGEVELVRTGFVPPRRLPRAYPAALAAARAATGCVPIPGSLSGDPAVIRLSVRCDPDGSG